MKAVPLIVACIIVLLLCLSSFIVYGHAVITIPASMPVSAASSTAYDNHSKKVDMPDGELKLIRVSDGRGFLHIPTRPSATSLGVLYDSSNGLVFRNDTLVAPVRDDTGTQVARLVVTTDDMEPSTDGYYGRITGIELDIAPVSISRERLNISVAPILYLSSLPVNGTFFVTSKGQVDIPQGFRGYRYYRFDVNGSGKMGYMILQVAVAGNLSPDEQDKVGIYRLDNGSMRRISREPYVDNGTLYMDAVATGYGSFYIPFIKSDDGQADGDTIMAGAFFGAAILLLSGMIVIILKRLKRF